MTTETTHTETKGIVLTAEIKRLIRRASAVCLDFNPDPTAPAWLRDRKLVTLRISIRKNGAEQTHLFKGHGFIGSGYRNALRHVPRSDDGWTGGYSKFSEDASNLYAPESGCWVCTSAAHSEHLQSIFRVIPIGSELTFRMALDYGSSPATSERGIHVDILSVKAEPPAGRKGTRPMALHFDLDHEVTKQNTARFGWRSGMPIED